MTTAASPGPRASGLFGTLLAGNLGGALVTFAYFRFLDPSAMADVAKKKSAQRGRGVGLRKS